MLLESVAYARPDTVAEALQLLAENEDAAPLAGGQSLINVLKHRVASLELLVDISRLEELRGIAAAPDGGLEIGACVTYDELDHSPEVRSAQPMLADVAGHIEDQQIRDAGTIGGNCCLSDPTNNLPPLLVALGATMVIASSGGPREVAASDFFHGYFATAVGEGELLTSVRVPPLAAGASAGYSTVAVGADSKAIARAAALVRANGTIEEARVVLACVSPIPARHAGMEEALRGRAAEPAAVAAAAERIGADLEPLGDAHGSAEYRRAMARVVARRAVCQAIGNGGPQHG
ncbi:MAG: xanthine dehydrogenase family protein subunit M [Solirubrobacterales bacterium]|nr:xanthine dehydrogenase family protein subunit M [Solirubrobacterales bacterium]MBV9715935.1 xanthine dehydrogenase family protein subunit M [Solirubrobacterales bacterium]